MNFKEYYILFEEKLSSEKIEKIKQLRKQGLSVNNIAKQVGVSHDTVFNYLFN